MAISHAQPLLLLLVSLFILPALTQAKFHSCDTGRKYPIKVSDVKISPDPVKRSRADDATIKITGVTSEEIPDETTVEFILSIMGMPASKTKNYSLCDITACPVTPGPLVLTFHNFLTERERKAFTYLAVVRISKTLQDQKMCLVFPLQIRGVSLLSQVIEY